jgi:hypothetical protein
VPLSAAIFASAPGGKARAAAQVGNDVQNLERENMGHETVTAVECISGAPALGIHVLECQTIKPSRGTPQAPRREQCTLHHPIYYIIYPAPHNLHPTFHILHPTPHAPRSTPHARESPTEGKAREAQLV